MALDFVIIGGGPAGTQAATVAARLGARVTVIERDVVGGAAHLWDCVPSKAMIAAGAAFGDIGDAHSMGVQTTGTALDLDALREHIAGIVGRLESSGRRLLESQHVRIIQGSGRVAGPNSVIADTADGPIELHADAILVSTGSRPRVPDFAKPDGDRILTTRDAYPPRELPEHLIVIGSGVTGVEFVHMFQSIGSKVTLIVSRQQVLPQKDPEVAAVLEADFLRRGVRLYKGARAIGIEHTDTGVKVVCDDGRVAEGSHALLAIGSVPNTETLGLEALGIELNGGYVRSVDHHMRTSVPHVYVAGDISGKLPLSSVASMQGRKIAEHVMGLHVVAQGPRHQGSVRYHGEGPDQQRLPGIRQAGERPGDRRGARRVDRGASRCRADLGDRRRRDRGATRQRCRRQPVGAPGARRGADGGGRVTAPPGCGGNYSMTATTSPEPTD